MCRVADPEEVAACATILARNAARYITGACLSVDGGVDAPAGKIHLSELQVAGDAGLVPAT